jgi:hypothetical protein
MNLQEMSNAELSEAVREIIPSATRPVSRIAQRVDQPHPRYLLIELCNRFDNLADTIQQQAIQGRRLMDA